MQFSDLDLNKTYTYADYLKWTFDERLELIKGRIFKMSPAPAEVHQRISAIVGNELYNYLKGKPCRVYAAPFDVRLVRKSVSDQEVTTVLQPDICVICDLHKIDKKGCIGAPDIVVEILSKGNNKTELKNKYEVYEEAGVKEYWIIQPQGKMFFKYILNENGKFQPTKILTLGDEITSPILPGFSLSLDEVFAELLNGLAD
ncbi:Uma2 family endonuclease [Mucilaginibacter arboris]|uniref:Uma2 family endonuclease n=1 Tax=Mucilaginibacter arboris TaxID=2682090 RepID=A0A7K1SX92_9SPHI|nr:Uma2 family endonuclease [Mucilaginibacter arboris]MVN21858.1 Uma2 family endonuclease [Mucilaginibacter arboris]